jgi:hypothetical protein
MNTTARRQPKQEASQRLGNESGPGALCRVSGSRDLRAGPGEGGNPHAPSALQKAGHRLRHFAAGRPSSGSPLLATAVSAQTLRRKHDRRLANRGLPTLTTKKVLANERLTLVTRGEDYGKPGRRALAGGRLRITNGPLFFHRLSIIRAAVFHAIPL